LLGTVNSQATLDEAIRLIHLGRKVFPISDRKLPYANCDDCRKYGADPAHRDSCVCMNTAGTRCHGVYAATDSVEVLEQWLEETPEMGLAVATGLPSGVLVCEYDPKNGGDESYLEWAAEHGAFETETNMSPGGGYHFILQMPNFDVRNIHGKLAPGIDVKGSGGYHVVPPTKTEKGAYVKIDERSPSVCPDWFRDKLFQYQSRNRWVDNPGILHPVERREYDPDLITDEQTERVERTIEYWGRRIRNAPDGIQNVLIYTASRCLFSLSFAGLLDEQLAEDSLLEACEDGNHPQHRSVLAIESGKRMAMSNPDPVEAVLDNDVDLLNTFSMDDMGNANRVLFWKGLDIRFDPDRERFHTWSDTKWVYSKKGRIREQVVDVIEKINLTEAAFYSDINFPPNEIDKKRPKSYREVFTGWSASQRFTRKISDCMTALEASKGIWSKTDDFDLDPFHFNVLNGVVDLRTGELLPHDRSYMCTQIANVKYDPKAKAPHWEEFLDLTQPNRQHRRYLQRLMGYALIGKVIDQIFVVHIGSGGNGKGVFLDCCSRVMGEYATVGQRESFIRKPNSNRIPADIASMEGKRIVLVDELNDNQKMDDALLKDISGGGSIKAEAKNVNPWEYTPRFILHFRTNHLPDIPSDPSIVRRFHPVKWMATPTSVEWDIFRDDNHRSVDDYLFQEASGILNWILEGTKEYLKNGLQLPEDLEKEALAMLKENDPFLIFMSESVASQQGCKLEGHKLHAAYAQWFKHNEFPGKPASSRTLYKEIKSGRYKDMWEWDDVYRNRFHLLDVQLANLMDR
jgi:putative DNA primase/helicase